MSTLILMLPLIVVPALVVLRPSERNSGVSSHDLAASDTNSDDFLSDTDDFDSVFGREIQSKSFHEDGHPEIDNLMASPLANLGQLDSKIRDANQAEPSTANRRNALPASPREPDSHGSFDLSRWGVTQTVWFTPGDAGVTGLAVFVPAPTKNGHIRYRFEAIGDSDEQVVQDVVRQINDWTSLQNTSNDGRVN
jgi:hypothetical protein